MSLDEWLVWNGETRADAISDARRDISAFVAFGKRVLFGLSGGTLAFIASGPSQQRCQFVRDFINNHDYEVRKERRENLNPRVADAEAPSESLSGLAASKSRISSPV